MERQRPFQKVVWATHDLVADAALSSATPSTDDEAVWVMGVEVAGIQRAGKRRLRAVEIRSGAHLDDRMRRALQSLS